MNQPMGNSGVKIDPLTGTPLWQEERQREKEDRNLRRLADACLTGQALRAGLSRDNSLILRELEGEMAARAAEVLAGDPEYQALLRFAQRLGAKINLVPRMVRRQLQKALGDKDYFLSDDEAAPEGIPAE